jgi:hypothetical protein
MKGHPVGLAFLVVGCSMLVGSTPCLASLKEASVRKILAARYAKLVAAFMSRDSRAAVQVYQVEATPDYVDRSPHGGKAAVPTSRGDILTNLRTDRWTPAPRMTFAINHLTTTGDRAVVQVDLRVVTTVKDGETGDASGQPHEVSGIVTLRDIWVKLHRDWKLQLTEQTGERSLVDGKSQPPEPH